MKIDVNSITPRQQLIIEKGLCDYRYIMENWQKNDDDFQSVFYDFYLKARWSAMSKEGNKKPYFELLQKLTPDYALIDILDELKTTMDNHSYELSLGSKLLHTRNPQMPIYDSKVRDYLIKNENVVFWWYQGGAPRGTTKIKKIEHDWNELVNWYNSFLSSDRGKSWINWFNNRFQSYDKISDVKKIDFIIFATN